MSPYRLALAATFEYCNFFGGTVSAAQASVVTAVNRVDGVYESEVAVRMILVANNSSLMYASGPASLLPPIRTQTRIRRPCSLRTSPQLTV